MVVGASAAGKTTLARVLTGAYQATRGCVRLDSADVFNWERADFGQHVGYIPQQVELFMGSVAKNIARMQEPDYEEVITAAQMAGAHELILHLPDGYETELKDNGRSLSGGQRQRIALAPHFLGVKTMPKQENHQQKQIKQSFRNELLDVSVAGQPHLLFDHSA